MVMRMLLLGIVSATSGCEFLFPLDSPSTSPPGDGPPGDDGPPPDAGLPAVKCVAVGARVELPLLADTFLDGTDVARGGETSMVFGGTNKMLLKFHSFPIRPHNLIFELQIERATTAEECGVTCGECIEIGALPEDVVVRVTRPDWDELAVTSTLRDEGESWTSPGPADPDVSLQISASTQHTGLTTEIQFQVSTNLPIDPTWTRDATSFLLEDTVVAPSRWVTRNSTCQVEKPKLLGICKTEALCGNGAVDSNEVCDDGNTDDGDGCSSDCLIAS